MSACEYKIYGLVQIKLIKNLKKISFNNVGPLSVLCLSTAGYSEKQDRDDLSHPVHVDNCLLVSELNECIKEPPAYTHRDYR